MSASEGKLTAAHKDSGSWRDFYQAAILEPDLNKLPERIVKAEIAIAIRARELFYANGDEAQEGESLTTRRVG